MSGALLGACIFFIITNFAVWISGMYEMTLEGFFTLLYLSSSVFCFQFDFNIIFSTIIEIVYNFLKVKLKVLN